MTTTTDNIRHADWCRSRPGETDPRIESYLAERTGEDGIAVIGRAEIVRCLECAERTIDGQPVPAP